MLRDEFELIGMVNYDGFKVDMNLIYKIFVLIDWSGYYIILGVWDVVDIFNVFYNVIDVNFIK